MLIIISVLPVVRNPESPAGRILFDKDVCMEIEKLIIDGIREEKGLRYSVRINDRRVMLSLTLFVYLVRLAAGRVGLPGVPSDGGWVWKGDISPVLHRARNIQRLNDAVRSQMDADRRFYLVENNLRCSYRLKVRPDLVELNDDLRDFCDSYEVRQVFEEVE